MNDWINFDLLSHPMNWIIVSLILIFMAYGAFAIWNAAGGFAPVLSVAPKEN